jgi:hypothetical protein
MQFGRIHGMALAILGIVLLGTQTVYYVMQTNVISGPTAVSQKARHAVNPLFGIAGLISLLVGVAIVATEIFAAVVQAMNDTGLI